MLNNKSFLDEIDRWVILFLVVLLVSFAVSNFLIFKGFNVQLREKFKEISPLIETFLILNKFFLPLYLIGDFILFLKIKEDLKGKLIYASTTIFFLTEFVFGLFSLKVYLVLK